MVVSLIISCIMGSIFLPRRNAKAFSESEMRAKFAVIFLSFIIVGILAIVSVLPVMTRVRDMHYIHRADGVIDSFSLAWALGNSEKWFIILSSFLFCTVFIGVAGLDADSVSEAIAFWVSKLRFYVISLFISQLRTLVLMHHSFLIIQFIYCFQRVSSLSTLPSILILDKHLFAL